MTSKNGKAFIHTIFWGIMLWLFGYILGIIFFTFLPQNMIGWYIMPIGTLVTLWVLFTKIKRDLLICYFGVGAIWTLIAIVFDYVFLVQLLQATEYYKPAVYIYYILTFTLPIIVGIIKNTLLKTTNETTIENNICQSCAMPLQDEKLLGSNTDNSPSTKYCKFCYQQGKFTFLGTKEEFIEKQVKLAQEKMGMTEGEARKKAAYTLPQLERWKT